MDFGERLDRTAIIRSILSAYTFGTGLFKEILQNSDDAKATTQVLLLDRRNHPTHSLYNSTLADKQGPALLAYNDAQFSENDWEGIRTIYQSSKLHIHRKSEDMAKVFGLATTCYQVTDTPQVLSGNYLAIFDPQGKVHPSGGVRLEVSEAAQKYSDQLSGFDCLAPDAKDGQSFNGTVFRLPLRTTGSSIKDQPVDAGQVEELLHEFIRYQVSEVLLFLTHVSCIEIQEIWEDGTCRLLSRTTARRVHSIPPDKTGMILEQHTCTINVDTSIQHAEAGSRSWRVVHGSFPESEAVTSLNRRCPSDDTQRILRDQKLQAKAAIAFPLDQAARSISGSLFTYLPLPLQTGLPAHVHALFALTPDRQHLRNAEEIGLGQGFDRISIAWNHFLFENLIPAIWARSLSTLVADGIDNIFGVWPPQQQEHQTGDALYWKHLPRDVLREVIEHKMSVWPLIKADSGVFGGAASRARPLSSILVASSSDDQVTVASLAKAGVPITQPPDYISTLLCGDSKDHTSLNPASAASYLRKNLSSRLASFSDRGPDIDRILVYLLSTKKLELIAGLPLLRSISGGYTSLQKRDSRDRPQIYTLLTDHQLEIFNVDTSTSQPSIALSQIPATVRAFISGQASSYWNISSLDSQSALNYLREALETCFGFTLDSLPTTPADPALITWLVAFWEWLSAWRYGTQLLSSVSSYRLLPTKGNTLCLATQTTFMSEGLHTGVVAALEAFGISFIHPSVTPSAQKFLVQQQLLKSAKTAADVLQYISAPAIRVADNVARILRKYLFTTLHPQSLSAEQRERLMGLPIYPRMACPPTTSGRTAADHFLSNLPQDKRIIMVKNMDFLPEVNHVIFVNDCPDVLQVLNINGSDDILVYRAVDVVALAVNNLSSQSCRLQCAFVNYITRNRDDIPQGVLRKLGKTSFIAVCGSGMKRPPYDVLDPSCEAATLFQLGDRYPSQANADEQNIVSCLQTLGLFRKRLDAGLVQECISHISRAVSPESEDLARRLLNLLVSSNYDLQEVPIDLSVRWLPTKHGLRNCHECHHPDAHPRVFFDHILYILDLDRLPPSFASAFGWDSDIPMDILKRQLVKIATSSTPQLGRRLRPMVCEIGRRVCELQNHDLAELRAALQGHPWVPISLTGDIIASTEHAVLFDDKSHPLPPRFHAIPQDLSKQGGVREFLRAMGCQERPPFSILMHDLHQSPPLRDVILILHAIADLNVEDEARKQVLVPDADGTLRPIDTVYFNDIGPRANLVELPSSHYLAHDEIDRDLATRLQLKPLGLTGISVPDDEDMGEDLTTRISGVLKQYAIGQAFGEFVSNAADAGATEFAVLVDTKEHVPAVDASSVLPAEFQSCHSLILHNNAQFKPEDWSGILRVGRGGKEGRTNSIGQFGLGSLSSFHFTEVPMILSGNRLLILDPSRSRLPEAGRASIMMSLSEVKRRYPDQITVFDGLFGFNAGLDSYAGTIFRFPLRGGIQATKSRISRNAMTLSALDTLIKDHLKNDAAGMLFFTRLNAIKVYHRDTVDTTLDWKVEVQTRDTLPVAENEGYEVQTLHILHTYGPSNSVLERWQTFTSCVNHSALPEEFLPLVATYRLREPVVTGLAIGISISHSAGLPFKFYSSVPLPLLTSLPFHVNGSFILASDRRSIRFDDNGSGNLESRYNLWLLKFRFPRVYAFALEKLMKRTHTDSKPCRWNRFWPERGVDLLSRAISDAFYDPEFLGQLDRRICCSETQVHQRPSNGRFVRFDDNISKALCSLRPAGLIVGDEVSSKLHSYKSIKPVDAGYLRKIISQKADAIAEAFRGNQLDVRDLRRLIKFLLENKSPPVLNGLWLLPLSDSTLVAFHSGDDIDDDQMFYSWTGLQDEHFSEPSHNLLPLNRLIYPTFSITDLLDQELNISRLTPAFVLQMMGEWLDEAPLWRVPDGTDHLPRVLRFWADWPSFATIGLSEFGITQFPVVPTTDPSCFISLSHCRSPAVVVLNDPNLLDAWLLEVLNHLGFIFVRRGCAGPALDQLLPRVLLHGDTMTHILEFFESQPDPPIGRISELGDPILSQFCNWARRNIPRKAELLNVARRLPIWQTLGNTYTPAGGRLLLPPAVANSNVVLPFLQNPDAFVGYDMTLHRELGTNPMTLQTLYSNFMNVHEGQMLSEQQLTAYQEFLTIMLNSPRQQFSTTILVPNTAGILAPAERLYARAVPIFAAAFETRPELFIHPTYDALEPRLGRFGLHTALEFNSFVACARVIHEDFNDPDPDRRESCIRRTEPLYSHYRSPTLAMQLGGGSPEWRRLDHLRFIPRRVARCPQRLLELPDFDSAEYDIVDLPHLISPSQILRPDLESVAWSQRGFFESAPDQRLLLADLQLGIPSVGEVVEHIRVLARIATRYAGSNRLLAEIYATYTWLSMREDKVELIQKLTAAEHECLFLNIDNSLYGVRELLQPFSPLLCAIGVEDGSPLLNLPRASTSPAEDQLAALRGSFNTMRQHNTLTD
ncbi:hypothetical protein EVG20_g7692, partial [Dentipellis fragilis]